VITRPGAKWIRHIYNQDIIKEILDYCKACEEEATKAERERALNDFMAAIEDRFDDTNNGRGVVGTIRGLKDSLLQPEPQHG